MKKIRSFAIPVLIAYLVTFLPSNCLYAKMHLGIISAVKNKVK